MILEELNITEEKFMEYLENYIVENPLEDTLKSVGLLPYETAIQVTPKIIKSNNLNSKERFLNDGLEINFKENSTRNYFLESSKMKMINEIELDKDIKTNQNNSLAA